MLVVIHLADALQTRMRYTVRVVQPFWMQSNLRRLEMKGVQFLVDEKGEKSAVLIDLKWHSELWEDFYDRAIARSREREPRESLESVKKRLRERKRLQNG
jgi:hypothetical protein